MATETRGKIFIGHGQSRVWKDLKDFLHEGMNLESDEFNREPTAGKTTKERLQGMLDDAVFAFLVLTAEDDHVDGTTHARLNVVHEVGLFQGRLGFERAIVLLEEGCSKFSNIHGLTHIGFPRDNISATFDEIRRVLEREGIPGDGEIPTRPSAIAAGGNSGNSSRTIALEEPEMHYLMTLSRPRHKRGVPLGYFDDQPSRDGERWQDMINKFLYLKLMRIGKSSYVITSSGYQAADVLWRAACLIAIEDLQQGQYDYVETALIATALKLTDGEPETLELQRHLEDVGKNGLADVVPTDGGISAARITNSGRGHIREYSDIDFTSLP